MAENNAPGKNDIAKNLAEVKHKLVVMSGKGGVGKSTVAANLALSLASQGSKVGLLDVDIHGPNIPKMLHLEDSKLVVENGGINPVETSQGIKVISMAFLLAEKDTPIIWRGPMKMGVIRQFLGEVNWGELDYLIIDLPPGTGDEPLSIAQLIPECDGSIVVTTPQEVALLDSRKSVRFSETINMPVLGLIENMSGFTCPHCGKATNLFKYGGGEEAAKEIGVRFLGRIPLDPKIMESGDEGLSFTQDNNGSEAAKSFGMIVKNIQKALDVKKTRKGDC
ncbi:MAG: Mrp/NBP35 family ATP-binding protein [Candidatus Thermoplasmatota archaeon]|nr:Mrp/NBP35 family ATP-binding protein [Candidatus Thermoplasmatota archaeon]